MNTSSNALRDAVVRRASNRRAYDQWPAQLQIDGFEVDHMLPRLQGGQVDISPSGIGVSAWQYLHVAYETLYAGN